MVAIGRWLPSARVRRSRSRRSNAADASSPAFEMAGRGAGVEPVDQVLPQPVGDRGVGAVEQQLSAAVELRLGGLGLARVVGLLGRVDRHHPDRLQDRRCVAVADGEQPVRRRRPDLSWEPELDHRSPPPWDP
jgi:hypothetical protein